MSLTFDEPLPFVEAVGDLRGRGVMPTTMSSAELAQIDAAVRRRSFFSARTPYADYLQRAQDLIGDLVAGTTDTARARLELKKFLDGLDYVADTPDEEGTLTDLRSDRRLNLVIDTNARMAQGFGAWQQGQDPALLDAFPAQELYRAASRKAPRDWAARWQEAGGQFFDGGRMIALKNDPIWEAISDFGNPYPPFAYGSGMDVRDVSRDEAERLGLIAPDETLAPLVRDFGTDGVGDEDAPLLNRHVRLLNSRVYVRDHLGRFAADGGPLSDADNIERGGRAIEHALRHERDVPNAMNVRGIGQVDFRWGTPGRTRAITDLPEDHRLRGVTHVGGAGISHITAKHPQDLRHVPLALVKGRVLRDPHDPHKREVHHDGFVVVLAKESRRKAARVYDIPPTSTNEWQRRQRETERTHRHAWVVSGLRRDPRHK